MNGPCASANGAPPDDADIRRALARLCDSPIFQSSPRLKTFLQYIVETTLAGNASSIKAYSIGIGALGRPSSFDPSNDASVRVEAGRLRAALARYYAQHGTDDALIISVPTGQYVPTFTWRDAVCLEAELLNIEEPSAILVERRAHRAQIRNQVASIRDNVSKLKDIYTASQDLVSRSKNLIERHHVKR